MAQPRAPADGRASASLRQERGLDRALGLEEPIDMEQVIPKRYAGFIGIGLMYLWAVTLLACIPLTQSETTLVKTIGFVGALLASASGLATFLYINGLECAVKDLEEKKAFHEAQANQWLDQAQVAIALLEKERATNVSK